MDCGELGGLLILRNELREDGGSNGALCTENRELFRDAFQLTDVSWPFVTHQHLLGFVSQHHFVHAVFLCHLQGKETEQKYYILTAVAEGRNLNLHLIETIIEILAKTSLADSLLDIDIRSRYDTYIRFANFRSTNRNVFAILQHA